MSRRGAVLILSYAVVMVLTILSSAFIMRTVSENNIARRYAESAQAFWLAEAGVSQALRNLRADYNSSDIGDTPLGAGGYAVDITANIDGTRTLSSRGFIPFSGQNRAARSIEVVVNKVVFASDDFYSNAIYSGGDIVINGTSYSIDGDVVYAGSISDTANITGDVTQDSSISPLLLLNFNQLRAMSQSQSNYHDTGHLDGPFPDSFWYNEDNAIPNVVFLEGSLDLSGKTHVGGFFVVGGDVSYDANISGNVSVDGVIYTQGGFTISGGGSALNVNGGVWASQVTLNGGVELAYNPAFMSAIDGLEIDTDVQIISWEDAQNP